MIDGNAILLCCRYFFFLLFLISFSLKLSLYMWNGKKTRQNRVWLGENRKNDNVRTSTTTMMTMMVLCAKRPSHIHLILMQICINYKTIIKNLKIAIETIRKIVCVRNDTCMKYRRRIDGAVVGNFSICVCVYVTRSIIAIIILHRVILFDSKQMKEKVQVKKQRKMVSSNEEKNWMPLTNFHWIKREKMKENCSTNLQNVSKLRLTSRQMTESVIHKFKHNKPMTKKWYNSERKYAGSCNA